MQHDAPCIPGAPEALGRRDLDASDSDVGELEVRAGHRGDLTREPEVREEIGAVRQHVHDEAHVAERHRLEQGRPRCRVDQQFEDALVLLAEPELSRRAEHAVGRLPADLALLDLEAARHDGSGRRERIEFARGDVRRATHDVEQLAGAHVHLRQVKMVGVGMRTLLDDARDDDPREIGAQWHELLDGRRVRREQIAQLERRLRRVEECVQPFDGGVHSATCSRKRTSES